MIRDMYQDNQNTFVSKLLNMKKIISIFAALSCVLSVSAQVRGLEANFTLTKTTHAHSTPEKSSGKIYYAAPGSLALHYSAPSTNLVVIDGTAVFTRQDGRERRFDTTKNAPMRSMSETLINCVKGDTQKVADENDADIQVQKFARSTDVTITARKKSARGYSRIQLSYRKSDGLLQSMKLTEFNGNVSEYKMTGFNQSATLPADAFTIPAKTSKAE